MSYLGIDIGTSAVKAVLIDTEQHCVAQASAPLTINRPQTLWSEQDPESWWQATCAVIDKLQQSNQAILAELRAIGLTGQMHGATCLDNNNQPVRPAILWNDGRSYEECKILSKHPAEFITTTGNLVMPGFTAPKLLWLKKNEPQVFANIAKVLLPKDYIRFKLSGVYATDLSDASGTSWLDVAERFWSAKLLAATGLTFDHMPHLYEGTAVTGELHHELAKRWGIAKPVKIVAGAGDNAAGAISLGIIKPDRAMLSLGTSGVYFVPNNSFNPYPDKAVHTYCHCLPGKWHQMGVVLSAAACISWWQQIITATSAEEIINEAQAAKLHQVPFFLPYLSGERTPHNNSFAQGVFFGLTHDTNRAEFTQAVLEGVAFAILDCQEALKEVGTEVTEISVIGGGAKSAYWGEILATILNKPLVYHNESNLGPAFGAAKLAMIGDLGTDPAAVATKPKVTTTIFPDMKKVEFYREKFAEYRNLYARNF